MMFIDTSVFIRYLTDDIPEKAIACEELFRKAVEGDDTLITSELVIAEIIWVLESHYELPKEYISDSVEKILNTPNLECTRADLIIHALVLYCEKNIDYTDAFNAVLLQEKQIDEIYSYDKHYDRIEWLTRLEPG